MRVGRLHGVRGVRPRQHGQVGQPLQRLLRLCLRQVHPRRPSGRRQDVPDHVQRGQRHADGQGTPDFGGRRRRRQTTAALGARQTAVPHVRGRAQAGRTGRRAAARADRRGRRLASAVRRPVGRPWRRVPVDGHRVPVPRARAERRLRGRPVRQGQSQAHVRAHRRARPRRARAKPALPEAWPRRPHGGQLLPLHGRRSGRARRAPRPGRNRAAPVPRVRGTPGQDIAGIRSHVIRSNDFPVRMEFSKIVLNVVR